MLNLKFFLALIFIIAGVSCFGAAYATKWDNHWGPGSIPTKGQARFNLSRVETIGLDRALTLAEGEASGKAHGIHLRNMHGYLVYMAEIITPDNQLAKVIVDAGDGRILFFEKHKPGFWLKDQGDAGRKGMTRACSETNKRENDR